MSSINASMRSFLLQALCVLPALVSAGPIVKRDYPAAGACSGDCQGYYHDPSVVYDGQGTYYRFTTNNKITISTASSISGPWTDQGAALPNCSIIDLPGNCDLWAPDVFSYDGTYYMYYAVSASGSQDSDIGVATSPSMAVGSWTDHGSIGIPADDSYNRIDPNLFQKDSGSPIVLNFGSYWENIFQVPMATPPLSVSGDITHLEYNATAPAPDEGSYEFWWSVDGTDYFYLFFSEGICCNDPSSDSGNPYRIMVCRSESGTADFVDQNGNKCLESGGTEVYAGSDANDVYGPGGQGVFYDPGQDSVVVYYHYMKPSVGYDYEDFQFGWNKLDFSSGWPVVVS